MRFLSRFDGPKNRMGGIVLITLLVILLALFTGCGEDPDEESGEQPAMDNSTERVIEKTGSIEAGDRTDSNHGNLAYDAWTFKAQFGNKVAVKVFTEDFIPLLKLVEVSTGAPLAEWDSQYSPGEGLTYTIAGPGEYEARVYAMKSGTGNYRIHILVK